MLEKEEMKDSIELLNRKLADVTEKLADVTKELAKVTENLAVEREEKSQWQWIAEVCLEAYS